MKLRVLGRGCCRQSLTEGWGRDRPAWAHPPARQGLNGRRKGDRAVPTAAVVRGGRPLGGCPDDGAAVRAKVAMLPLRG